jgi:HEAT repeat protein
MGLYSAISGLGETGTSSDADLLVPHVSHEVPRIRRAALRALARLHADQFVNVFEERLSDHAPSVSREAMKGLSKTLHLIGGERVWRAFNTASEVHARRNALFLIARLSKWESIGYLVEALGTNDEDLKKQAETYVRRWHWRFNRSFTNPTKAQVEHLSAALERCGTDFDQTLKEQLEFAIRAL